MIVYNVARAWFPMKNDAEAYRRQLGLPKEALFKLEINHRDELAALLNGLCGLKADEIAGAITETEVPPEVIERNYIEVPDYVPRFLAEQAAKREGKEIKWVKEDE